MGSFILGVNHLSGFTSSEIYKLNGVLLSSIQTVLQSFTFKNFFSNNDPYIRFFSFRSPRVFNWTILSNWDLAQACSLRLCLSLPPCWFITLPIVSAVALRDDLTAHCPFILVNLPVLTYLFHLSPTYIIPVTSLHSPTLAQSTTSTSLHVTSRLTPSTTSTSSPFPRFLLFSSHFPFVLLLTLTSPSPRYSFPQLSFILAYHSPRL